MFLKVNVDFKRGFMATKKSRFDRVWDLTLLQSNLLVKGSLVQIIRRFMMKMLKMQNGNAARKYFYGAFQDVCSFEHILPFLITKSN